MTTIIALEAYCEPDAPHGLTITIPMAKSFGDVERVVSLINDAYVQLEARKPSIEALKAFLQNPPDDPGQRNMLGFAAIMYAEQHNVIPTNEDSGAKYVRSDTGMIPIVPPIRLVFAEGEDHAKLLDQ